jgi:hypothetical protein
VQRGDGALGDVLEHREMDQVDVEVQHVEALRTATHLMQHRQMRREIGFQRRRIKPNRLVAHGYQGCTGFRLGAREQRDVVAKIRKRIREMGDDAFGATVQLWRNGLIQGAIWAIFMGGYRVDTNPIVPPAT